MKKIVFATVSLLIAAFTALAPASVFADGKSKLPPIETYIIERLKNFDKQIDVSDYAWEGKWGTDAPEKANKIFAEVVTKNPDLFFVADEDGVLCTSEYSAKKTGGTYLELKCIIKGIHYAITKEQYAAAEKKFQEALDRALAVTNDDMSDVQKALALYDYLILNTSYDHSHKNFDAYDALVGKSAVCNGYALAYIYLLREAGISAERVTSEKMNHAWVYVKIGDSYYHADPTWDDPSFTYGEGVSAAKGKERLGYVGHKNFLMSDEGIKKQGHHDWELSSSLPPASSTKYENAPWVKAETAVVQRGKTLYFAELDEKSPGHNKNYESLKLSPEEFNQNYFRIYTDIKSYDLTTGKTADVYKIDSTWFGKETENGGKPWWDGSYVCLAQSGGSLYFNTASGIYALSLADNSVRTIVEPELEKGVGIYGLTLENGGIKYSVKARPDDGDYNIRQIKIDEA
ncbi:MAG: hypothetical protein LBU36_04065 [Clostridiales bacterium]|nr:hypothetical protein [Clostridiales bacterium]